MRFYHLLIIGVLVVGGVGIAFREPLRAVYQDGVAASRVSYVCKALHEKVITREEVCSKALPEIEAFRWHYAREKVQDAAWFAEQGWQYFPEVHCLKETLKFSFMGREFHCEGARAEGIQKEGGAQSKAFFFGDIFQVAFAESENELCYGKKETSELRVVSDVLPSGILVLDNGEKVQLLGLVVPKEEDQHKELCGVQVKQYLLPRVKDQSVFLYQLDRNVFSKEIPMNAYVVTEHGSFLNQDLVRYGLAKVASKSAQKSLSCQELFLALERQARIKALGMWGDSCKH